ncbi:hypothetical protein [Bradyrhizobium hereditatis]|uniref:hypothetical protein n=1 Tax=Bradyrhizobium hereditatis TaxID=2821405 RepID=UPI0035D9529A
MSLHPEKTRLIEFGRRAATNRQRRGIGKPETFNFLGFSFICGTSRRGSFLLKRKSRRERIQAKLSEIKEEMRRRRHQPTPDQGKWLRQVVTGFFAYHAVPTNGRALEAFRYHIIDLWGRSLRRRSQKDHLTWARITKLSDDWAPESEDPSPLARTALRRQAPKVGAGCGKAACPDLSGGRSAMSVPTGIIIFEAYFDLRSV